MHTLEQLERLTMIGCLSHPFGRRDPEKERRLALARLSRLPVTRLAVKRASRRRSPRRRRVARKCGGKGGSKDSDGDGGAALAIARQNLEISRETLKATRRQVDLARHALTLAYVALMVAVIGVGAAIGALLYSLFSARPPPALTATD